MATDAVNAGSAEIAAAANDLAQRAEQQAAGLEETSAALGEIAATVRQTAAGVQEARKIASAARDDASAGAHIVQQAIDAMSKIENSSRRVSQVIGVIVEMAFQTNLLVLNAGVEAARAGETGRGFAVVASEVRALAQRSAAAAKEIKDLIVTSTAHVGDGVAFVARSGQALGRIEAQVVQLDKVIDDIASGSQEQAASLQQVSTAVAEMDQTTQQNAALSEQATASSQSLAEQAQRLASLLMDFRTGKTGVVERRSERRVA